MKHTLFTALLSALCLANAAYGGVRGAVCDGCNNTQMAAKATGTTPDGIVYVFNTPGAKVKKYEVFTEVLDLSPYTAWTQAISVQVESSLRNAFTDFAASQVAVQGETDIELPSDFPVGSVAGALAEPGSTATHIEQYLRSLSIYRQLEIDVGVLASNILKRNIPLVDLSNLIKIVKITIQFQDGTTQDYEIYYSMDVLSGEAQLEVEEAGNALLADGSPAPTGPLGFDGLEVRNVNGSLEEWLAWARLNGALISGPGSGTTMTCSISGGVIRCVVRTRN